MLTYFWREEGYQTIWVWLATFLTFTVLGLLVKPYYPVHLWFWGVAFFVCAWFNWRMGTRMNRRSLEKRNPQTVWRRLFYKSKHRFLMMPMETFSVAYVAMGLGFVVAGFLNPGV